MTEQGREQFSPRGIGLDVTPGCFVCGGHREGNGYDHNIAAFVESKEAGERVVQLFGGLARLDWRPTEPNWIQVKVGTCGDHLKNLEQLYELTFFDRKIDSTKIAIAKAAQSADESAITAIASMRIRRAGRDKCPLRILAQTILEFDLRKERVEIDQHRCRETPACPPVLER